MPDSGTFVRLSSQIRKLFADPALRLEWDNDLRYHFARHVIKLRQFRELTQAELSERAGVAQPRIAEIEAGDANVTARTIERVVSALEGRLRFAIEPAERPSPRLPEWYQLPTEVLGQGEPWARCVTRSARAEDGAAQFFAGWSTESVPASDQERVTDDSQGLPRASGRGTLALVT